MGTQPSFAAGESGGFEPAEYTVVEALFDAPFGSLRLCRAKSGPETGRLALARLLPEPAAAVADEMLRAGSGVEHPRLLRTLGIARIGGKVHALSEFAIGVSLWELEQALFAQPVPLALPVALRIVCDLLSAVELAHERIAGTVRSRVLFAETAWIAASGQTLLVQAELGGAVVECVRSARKRPPGALLAPEEMSGAGRGGVTDCFVAGALLWQLLAHRGLTDAELSPGSERPIVRLDALKRPGLPIPRAVADIVARALSREPAQRYASPGELYEALTALPKAWLGSEADVARTLEETLWSALAARRALSAGRGLRTDATELSPLGAMTRTAARPRATQAPDSAPASGPVLSFPPGADAASFGPPAHGLRTAGTVVPARSRSSWLLAAAGVTLVVAAGAFALGRETGRLEAAAEEASRAKPVAPRPTPTATALPAAAALPAPQPAPLPAPQTEQFAAAEPSTSAPEAPASVSQRPRPKPRAAPAPPTVTPPAAPSSFKPTGIAPYRPQGI